MRSIHGEICLSLIQNIGIEFYSEKTFYLDCQSFESTCIDVFVRQNFLLHTDPD